MRTMPAACSFNSFFLCFVIGLRRILFGTICRCISVSRKSLATKPKRAKVATGNCRWIRPKVRRSVSAIDGNNGKTPDAFQIIIGIYAITIRSKGTRTAEVANINQRMQSQHIMRTPKQPIPCQTQCQQRSPTIAMVCYPTHLPVSISFDKRF